MTLRENLQALDLRHLSWRRVFRIVPGAVTPAAAYEDAVSAKDLEILLALENNTEANQLSLIPVQDRAIGAGAGYIMPAFTNPSVHGSRFAPPNSYGIWYAAHDEATAIAETRYHRESVFKETAVPPGDFDQHVLIASVRAYSACDIRGKQNLFPEVYNPNDYTAAREAGVFLKNKGADVIAYDSVRRSGGECLAVLKPRCVNGCRRQKMLTYRWDGNSITDVLTIRLYRS